MAIQFTNIKTGEKRLLKSPHQIGAFLNSSDLHVNSNLGQDFGWRLAPSIVRRIELMREDSTKLDEIARRTGIEMEDITNIHLVTEISRQDALAERDRQRAEGENSDKFKSEYEKELEELRQGNTSEKELQKTEEEKPVSDNPAAKEANHTTKKLK